MMNKKMMNKKMEIKDIVMVAFMTAVMAVLSPISLPIGPVPISLATFAVCLSATVFSNYEAGLAKLLGPTGGYLIGMIFLSYLGGLGLERFSKEPLLQYAFFLLGMLFCYILGTLWLARLLSFSFFKALAVGVIPFIVPDCIKVFLAVELGKRMKKSLKKGKAV